MLITDAQVHIWGANTPERPWPRRAEPQRPIPLEKDELLREMDAAGVDRVIIVPPSWEGDRNDLALEATRLHPARFRIMGRLDTDLPDAPQQIANWLEQPGMLGLRFVFTTAVLQEPLLAGRMDWVWSAAEKAGVPVMALFPHALMHIADDIATRHPNLKLVIDHLGFSSTAKDEAAYKDFDNLLPLARHRNVAVKASGLPCFSAAPYPFRDVHQYVRKAFDAFGPHRVFWGTDLSRLPCPYRQGVTMFTEAMPWLGGDDLELVMGRAICEYLGWNIEARTGGKNDV
jgi:predicted TIM-barrel fold metal-dependent hydrolase